jgi:hypothetical protein
VARAADWRVPIGGEKRRALRSENAWAHESFFSLFSWNFQ